MADRGRGRGQGDRGRGRGDGGAPRGGRGRGGFEDRGGGGRGRGGFEDRGGGRGRGGFEDRGGGRGRGGFEDRGGGRGRGGFEDRGGGRGRGGFEDRGGGRGRGGFDRGSDRGGGGFRGGAGGRGGRGGFQSEPAKFYGNGIFPQPDPEVTKIETSLIVKDKDISAKMAATSLGYRLPQRPGYGTAGKAIVLWTNYLKLEGLDSDTTLYRYSVAFQPDTDLPNPKKKRMIQLLLKMAPFSGIPSASDWAQVIITSKKVDLGDKRQQYDVEWFPADGEPLPPPTTDDDPRRKAARKRNTRRLLVEEIGTVSLSELMKDLSSSTIQYPLKLETIQALNIIMLYGPSSDPNITTASQNKFYPFGSHPQTAMAHLGSGLQALRGYFSSVRTGVSRILVNINVATGAFYKDGPLLELLSEIANPRPQNKEQHRRLGAFVRKLRFETNYMTEKDKKGKVIKKRKVYTIFDLSPFEKNANNVKFTKTEANGQTTSISVAQHFQQTWNVTLRTPGAPLVNYGSEKNPKWIPAELCSVLPGQLAKRLLQGDQTREMIAFAARRPFANAESIMGDGLKVTKISTELNSNLTRFGIKVDAKLLTVPGRILPAPILSYRTKTCTPQNGAWNLNPMQLGAKPFPLSRPLVSWNCLVINSGNYETIRGGVGAVTELLRLFRQTLDTYGMNPGPVQAPAFASIHPGDLQGRNISKIQNDLTSALKQGFPGPPTFLYVILPSDNALLYDSIKYVCDVQLGIPNICNIGSKFSKEKGQMQYFANVAMKFNQKLGGMNHSIQIDRMKPLDNQTILFGIDVTHPSPGSSEESPSIAGVVASIDVHFAQYPASIRTQKGKKEMVTELEDMISERLKLWRKKNQGRLPNKVIVYRDGVSEGQFRTVMEEEYPSFVKAFTKLYGKEDKHPKISIIVVGKRHHTRFYPTKEEDSDGKTGNPKPGTVVDRGVTGEKLFDFFLLAHQGLQGTSKPAHYVVLKDDNKFGADQLQNLTHNLCYTFARATRAVSICPPAYYADLLCERGRSYLHGVLKGEGAVTFSQNSWQRDVHPNLAETMFYL